MTDIQLRQYQQNDVDAIYEAVMESKAELSPWMMWCHENHSRKDAVTWVEGRPGAWDRNESWSFVVVEPGGKLLGTCGIHRTDSLNGIGELGYWVRSTRAIRMKKPAHAPYLQSSSVILSSAAIPRAHTRMAVEETLRLYPPV